MIKMSHVWFDFYNLKKNYYTSIGSGGLSFCFYQITTTIQNFTEIKTSMQCPNEKVY